MLNNSRRLIPVQNTATRLKPHRLHAAEWANLWRTLPVLLDDASDGGRGTV